MTKEEAEAKAARLNKEGAEYRGCKTKWSAGRDRDGEWCLFYERYIPPDLPDAKNPY